MKQKKKLFVREVAPRYWSDYEVLSIIIGAEAAESLLNTINGRLSELHDLEIEQLRALEGIGRAKALQIRAVLELGKRIAQSKKAETITFRDPRSTAEFLIEEMRHYKKEHVKILLLTTKNCLISIEDISVGSLNASIIHPREIFNPAVKKNAAAIIMVHNHPSGDPSPSREDLEITNRLTKASEILGIQLLDHIIIGDGDWVSLKERRLIE